MKKFFLSMIMTAFAMLIMIQSISAQNVFTTSSSKSKTTSTEEVLTAKGTQSVAAFGSFSYNSDFKVRSGIMYSIFVADGLALRANIRLGYANDKTGDDDEAYATGNDIALGLGLQKHIITSKRVTGYLGADFMVGSISNVNHYKYGSSTGTEKENNFEAGLRPFMGIEYHFVPNFYIGAEWGYDILFNSSKNVSKDGSSTEENITSKNTILNIADLSAACIKIGFSF